MDVDPRFADGEDRIGHRTVLRGLAQLPGQPLGKFGVLRFARQVHAVEFETVVAVRFDEVERLCSAGQGREPQHERRTARIGHPEQRVGRYAFGPGEHESPGGDLQIAVRRNDDPVFGPVVGVHVEHGRRVAQFDFHDVERLGVGRGDQRVFHDPVSRGAGRQQRTERRCD